jgi:indole-3-glycerol phosphate synthase
VNRERAAAAPSPDLLATIVAATRRIVSVRREAKPRAALEREITRTPDGRAFADALRHSPPPRVIAECKRRSPSRGILRRDYDPACHAAAYASAGAAAISVLTEPTFFDGSPEHLRAVRNAVTVPLLRKDFIVSDYQIAEAAVLGADAVLLIVSALADQQVRDLLRTAREYGLAALVEAHELDEVSRARDAGAEIIGVNSRNLRTLDVDRSVLERAIEKMPADATAVAESGIKTPADMNVLGNAGYHAFLVGERLIIEEDPGEALRELRQTRQ